MGFILCPPNFSKNPILDLLAGRQAGRKYNNCQPKKSSWELVGGDFPKKKTADGTEQKETWDDEQEGSPTFFSSSLVKREETAMFGSTHVVVLEVSVLQGRYLFHKHAYKKVQTLQERGNQTVDETTD